ncbi:hypothetical protein VNO77_34090 [Canavalia gladiata]|uniref:Uncharacterized protein n=1 Tax=Canavalia gladiata TaxID=3824 RepID=A0AAN9KEI7_CANGL
MSCESKTWLVLYFLLLVASCMQHCVSGQPEVPCFFIFGDSLSDVGNNNYLQTTSKANYEPCGVDFPIGPTGRYTNDLTHISFGEHVENHRGIVSQIASKLGGLDNATQYLSKCLYYVNLGTNDYEVNYFLPNSNTSNIYTLDHREPERHTRGEINTHPLLLYVIVEEFMVACIPTAWCKFGSKLIITFAMYVLTLSTCRACQALMVKPETEPDTDPNIVIDKQEKEMLRTL